MANIITSIRIICSIIIIFCAPFSSNFYIFYLIAGFTDMIDGTIARKTNKANEFGSKFDTIADLTFAFICLIKIIPELKIPNWLFIWIFVIFIIKIVNIISGYIMKKEFIAVHTIFNKIKGAALFILPLTLVFIDIRYSGSIICALATFAAIQEGHFIRTKKLSND